MISIVIFIEAVDSQESASSVILVCIKIRENLQFNMSSIRVTIVSNQL